MPVRPLNLSALTPATIAMYDLLADGEWHANDVIIAAGGQVCARDERDEALKNGYRIRRRTLAKGNHVAEEDILASGAKDIARNRLMIAVRSGRVERDGHQHRMLPTTISEWVLLRPHLTQPNQASNVITLSTPPATPPAGPEERSATVLPVRAHKQNVFGGMSEPEGFAQAPLEAHDRVHFRTEGPDLVLADFRRDLPEACTVTVDEGEGLYRVECPLGEGPAVRDHVRDWCDDHGVTTRGLRPETNIRRRHPRDLDPRFLRDLCEYYAPYSMSRLRRHMSTIKFHISDPDDIQQQVAEWILKSVSMYDDTQGVPFGAFHSQRLSKWVHDLSRNAFGRTATDAELRQGRAIAAFTHEFGRKPTEVELAERMGQNLTTFRRNAQTVATLAGLRNMQALDSGEGEIDLPLPDPNQTDDEIMDETGQSMVSQMLTNACTPDPNEKGRSATRPNVLAWITFYEQTWGNATKADLSTCLATSPRNLNVHAARAQARMRAHATEHELYG